MEADCKLCHVRRPQATVLACLVLLAVFVGGLPTTPGRRLAVAQLDDRLFPPELADESYVVWGGATDDVYLQKPPLGEPFYYAVRIELILRLTGAIFVPFTQQHQRAFVASALEFEFNSTGVTTLEIISYREGQPDLRFPFNSMAMQPYVDVAFSYEYLLAPSILQVSGKNLTDVYRQKWQQELANFMAWTAQAAQLGGWAGPSQSWGILQVIPYLIFLRPPILLHPVVVMEAAIGFEAGGEGGGVLLPEQATLVQSALERLLIGRATNSPPLGTLVQVTSRDSLGIKSLLPEEVARSAGTMLLLLELSIYTCLGNATLPEWQCEQQIVEEAFATVVDSQGGQWLLSGLRNPQLLLLRERPSPQPPAINASALDGQWVPWHLDRLDQTTPSLDGDFTANATGSGVNIYLISSGVRADHQEFKYLDGRPGSRVKPAWGFEGLDPLTDCPDYDLLYGFGTFAASIIAGLTSGAAKNATIYSVRYRRACLYENDADIWQTGRFAAAIDSVLSNHHTPAIIVLDTWWTPSTLFADDDEQIQSDVRLRLDLAYANNISVIVGAGYGSNYTTVTCDGVFANHPAAILVAPADAHDNRAVFGSWNSSCISLWAPGGSLGMGLVGASPAGPNNYTNAVARIHGAAWVAAGVAAQYLSLHPTARPDELRRALQASATKTVTGTEPLLYSTANLTTTTGLLFSNYCDPGPAAPPSTGGGLGSSDAEASGGSGTSPWVWVGVAAGAAAAACCAILAAIVLRRRRRLRQLVASNKSAAGPDGRAPSRAAQASLDSSLEAGTGQAGSSSLNATGRALLSSAELARPSGLVDMHDVATAERLLQLPARPAPNPFLLGQGTHGATGGGVAPNPFWQQPLKQPSNVELIQQALLHPPAEVATLGPGAFGQAAGAASSSGGGESVRPSLLPSVLTPSQSVMMPTLPSPPGEELEATRSSTSAGLPGSGTHSSSGGTSARLSGRGLPCASDGASGSTAGRSLGESRLSLSSLSEGSQEVDGKLLASLLSLEPLAAWELDPRQIQLCTHGSDGALVALGSGSFGKVYLGLQNGVTRVAVKLVRRTGQRSVKAMRNEVAVQAACRNPNIVQLYGACFWGDDHLMIVTEYMPGGDLSRCISLSDFRWYKRGRQVALDVAKGLVHMHSHNLVHLDLKSSNILLAVGGTAKIADMGLSKVLSQPYLSSNTTPLGTFTYASPEVILGNRCTAQADIFSFGVVLWEVVTGDVPMRGLLRPPAVPEECPQAVADLIDACMLADPRQRPTARQVFDVLASS